MKNETIEAMAKRLSAESEACGFQKAKNIMMEEMTKIFRAGGTVEEVMTKLVNLVINLEMERQ